MDSGMNTDNDTLFNKRAIRKPVLAVLLMVLPFAVCAQEVGKIKYARGAVTLQNADGSEARLVGTDDLILQGEVIKTGPRSFAVITLQDDTKMTLRPKTTFAVEEMHAKKDKKASALLRLFRGGLRTITGFISKFNPDGYHIRTAVATIGIRGTEFDARLCEDDCAKENNAIENKQEKKAAQTVARAVFVRGGLSAKAYAGGTRELKSGDAIYEGDTLSTGDNDYAIIVFRDRSRVSLQSNTDFRVDELKYDEKKKESHSALFSLLKGGLRTVTGLIGKFSPQKYRMRTAVATIGIRGTGYDLLCTGPCVSGGDKSSTPKEGEGLWANVWSGKIAFGDRVLDTNQAGFIKDRATPAEVLPDIPRFFQQNPVPKPTDFKVDESKLFVGAKTQKVEPGLYVSVTHGKVSVSAANSGQQKTVTANQALFTDASGKTINEVPVPAFQQFDNIPKPDSTNVDTLEFGAGVLGDSGDKDMVCEIK
jgi:hypothetical protein